MRLTFFPMGPDIVRQLSEAYMPDGTWTVNCDLIYTWRKGKEPDAAAAPVQRPAR